VHLNEKTEILIERCVDDELDAERTHSLMMDMDQIPDGWKTLACRFLEERKLRQRVAEVISGQQAASSDDAIAVPGVLSSTDSASAVKGSRNWFGHPMVSLTLCAAIAFVSGLLIPKSDGPVAGSQGAPVVAQGNTALGGSDHTGLGNVAEAGTRPRAVPRYTLEWTPRSGQQTAPLEIPVYQDVDDWAQNVAEDRQLVESHRSGIFSENTGNATRVFRLPVNDSEDILLFVQEQDLDLPLQ